MPLLLFAVGLFPQPSFLLLTGSPLLVSSIKVGKNEVLQFSLLACFSWEPKAQCVLKRVTLWASFITTILMLVMGNSFTLVLPYTGTSLCCIPRVGGTMFVLFLANLTVILYCVAQGCCFYGDAPSATLACS